MFSEKTIFIAALDWGLGHATRCVPIIRELSGKNKIIIGVTPLTRPVFDEEFPAIQKIDIPAYNIKYSSVFPLWLKLLFDWPRISGVIKKENKVLERIILENKIDIVISDNRFGLFSKDIYSIFITHQLFLKTPVASAIAQNKNRKFIQKFNEVWVPDYENGSGSLSGELSHGNHFHKNVKYIGPQTRLQKNNSSEIKYDYLFLLSGPQPQHALLRKILISKAGQYPHLKFAMVTYSKIQVPANTELFISPTGNKLSEIIAESKNTICRSGYSTLMDLHLLGKNNLILVPTPGQTEQEYLAYYFAAFKRAKNLKQTDLKRFAF